MQDSLQFKLDQLFQLRTRGIKPGLDRINQLLDFLEHPEKHYPIIHVAGTNGKGSTCRVVQALLSAAGYRVGLYTSPHLLRFSERIRIDDQQITDDELLQLFTKFDQYMDQSKATFFEITTAMALDYFFHKKVDIAVLEVGLGGRFDATNAVTPEIAVITSIGRDHEEFLGYSIQSIASEKAGILKENIPLVLARQTEPEARKTIKKIAQIKKVKIISADDTCNIQINQVSLAGYSLNLQIQNQFFKNINFPLLGDHQLENFATALSIITFFPKIKLNMEFINSGLKSLKNPARFELIDENPAVIYDVAHNLSGIKVTIDCAKKIFSTADVFIAMKASKNLDNLGLLLKELQGKVYISEIEGEDSKDSMEIYNQILRDIEKTRLVRNPDLDTLLQQAIKKRERPLIILGSHYMAKNIYKYKK
ncbi:MAG: bifunctional folylpolyglutamate synthase/dihydrofolate synthase [Candidatus Marinimicrobia bacterium]|nr:bifunctional folylpolyglutamate synthase/dihydrofolate synthase [Candidatus Neomarinimicrobiota bacterium]